MRLPHECGGRSVECRQDVISGLGPAEGFRVCIGGLDVNFDSLFEIGDRAEHASPERISVSSAKKRLTWLIHDADVGVKCTCQHGRLANQLRINLVLGVL